MPFGISSASEHFQKRMSAIVLGLEGVLCLMDDVLVLQKYSISWHHTQPGKM